MPVEKFGSLGPSQRKAEKTEKYDKDGDRESFNRATISKSKEIHTDPRNNLRELSKHDQISERLFAGSPGEAI